MRFIAVIISLFFIKDLVSQCLIVTMSTLSVIMLLGLAHPFSEINRNYREIFSELVIIIIMEFLMVSSDSPQRIGGEQA